MVAAPLAFAGFLALWSPGDEGVTVCPFALATGHACPGCGMTRAIGYLARGDLATALSFHPLVVLIALQAISGWGWLVLRNRGLVRPLANRLVSAILVGTAFSLFAVWALRAVFGTLPPV